jgi:hypothetical protein
MTADSIDMCALFNKISVMNEAQRNSITDGGRRLYEQGTFYLCLEYCIIRQLPPLCQGPSRSVAVCFSVVATLNMPYFHFLGGVGCIRSRR